MATAPLARRSRRAQAQASGMTLLELVTRLGRVLDDDRDVVAAAHALLDAGRVRLTGSFRGGGLRGPAA